MLLFKFSFVFKILFWNEELKVLVPAIKFIYYKTSL